MIKAAILQSNYIPWKGYFDLLNSVDEFVIYDDVQYTKRDWRNRNKIKTHNGLIWITIPVNVKGKYNQLINETKVSDKNWNKEHWKSILLNYSKSQYFREYKSIFEELYCNCKSDYLNEINYHFMYAINEILGIKTNITYSSQYNLPAGQTERLLGICKELGATEYISGPAAKNYINEELFKQENIKLTWMDYSGYPEYNQLYPPFEHGVSILDLIFSEGPNSVNYMKSFG